MFLTGSELKNEISYPQLAANNKKKGPLKAPLIGMLKIFKLVARSGIPHALFLQRVEYIVRPMADSRVF